MLSITYKLKKYTKTAGILAACLLTVGTVAILSGTHSVSAASDLQKQVDSCKVGSNATKGTCADCSSSSPQSKYCPNISDSAVTCNKNGCDLVKKYVNPAI